jgi:hypothetical protein
MVDSAGWSGFRVESADDNGIIIGSAGKQGVRVVSSGYDGVYVFQAGDVSGHSVSDEHNGFEVCGAQGHGLFVGHALMDGVHVDRAGDPSTTYSSVYSNGLEVEGAEGYGVRVGRSDAAGVMVYSSGGSGVLVNSAGQDGMRVDSAVDDGVQVLSADDIGVIANTTQADHEWGFYTNDKIYAGTATASAGPSLMVAQSGEEGMLETGDVVAVSGVGAPFAGSEFPVPQVQRGGSGAVLGVVYGLFAAEEEVEAVELEGRVETRTEVRAHGTQGPIAPGDYLLVVVTGPAQVKVEALSGEIRPGDLLRAAGGAAVRYGAGDVYTPGGIVGTAMESLDASRGTGLVWALVMPR